MDGKVDGRSLLHMALDSNVEMLKTLLEFRTAIDIDSLDDFGFTPLCRAVTIHPNISHLHVQALIRAGARINQRGPNGASILHHAALEAHKLPYLRLLLSQPDIDIDNPSTEWSSPLCVAAWCLNVEGVRALLDHGADVNFYLQNALYSTPLISVLGTRGSTTSSEDMLAIDTIIRMLFFNLPTRANVKQKVPGGRFYTALSAASLCSSLETLKLLLGEGADVHQGDPDTNCMPHHFAAANGIDNFQAIILSYRNDLMAADKENKNCLHWAAQFGNLKTVQYIISRLRDDKKLQMYINQPDSDGWTPLCWAVRPHEMSFWHDMRSEQPNYAGVVRALLLNDARPDVKCMLGNGTVTENLTPLDLAKRCDAGEEIINMLQHAPDDQTGLKTSIELVSEGPVRVYASNELYSICFNVSLNLAFLTLPQPTK